jgi:hypothetical protein
MAFAHGRVDLIAQKRHRRNLARTVAGLTLRLEDRENILVEGNGWLIALRTGRNRYQQH